MGGCLSAGKPNYVDHAQGGEEDFHNRYMEDKVLGEGEFAQVKLIHDMKAEPGEQPPLACKILRKGIVFKDNVVYTPLKPAVLKAECDMLKLLQGEHYCLQLLGVYETPKFIYLVTELCAGGEMMEYVSKQQELRTEDVSRISYQLLSAVNHCAAHGIIHRDIKPENCMFLNPSPGAELRLIDFGSGCIDDSDLTIDGEPQMHATFAGSAFYISPEMFQRTYTNKTDVWSVGVTLYVLVAGYPADELQKAFNLMQKSKNRDLRKLPNLSNDMPDSYYDMLDDLLCYRHRMRKSAGRVLEEDEFVRFHKDFEISIGDVVADSLSALPTNQNGSSKKNRTVSMTLSGSVQRHAAFMDYQRYERSVTTLLATLLSKSEFDILLKKLEARRQVNDAQKLNIIPISELKEILKTELKADQCLSNIDKLPNSENYQNFAYHVDLMAQFVRDTDVLGDGAERRHSSGDTKSDSVHGSNVFKDLTKKRRGGSNDNLNNSWHLGQTGRRSLGP